MPASLARHSRQPGTTVRIDLVAPSMSTSYLLAISLDAHFLVSVLALAFHSNFFSPKWIYTFWFYSCKTHEARSAGWMSDALHGLTQFPSTYESSERRLIGIITYLTPLGWRDYYHINGRIAVYSPLKAWAPFIFLAPVIVATRLTLALRLVLSSDCGALTSSFLVKTSLVILLPFDSWVFRSTPNAAFDDVLQDLSSFAGARWWTVDVHNDAPLWV